MYYREKKEKSIHGENFIYVGVQRIVWMNNRKNREIRREEFSFGNEDSGAPHCKSTQEIDASVWKSDNYIRSECPRHDTRKK